MNNEEQRKACLDKWLELFPGTYTFLWPEKGLTGRHQQALTTNYGLERNWKINEIDNYWLGYTPNGFLEKHNVEGGRRKATESIAEKFINAFVIDLDEWLSEEQLEKLIKVDRLPISYIAKTHRGYHLYMFVDKADQERINATFNLNTVLSIFFQLIAGADHVVKNYSRIIRCPFSLHKKENKVVQLFAVDYNGFEVALEEITSPDQVKYPEYKVWTFGQLQQLMNNYQQLSNDVSTREAKAWNLEGTFSEKVNVIAIADYIKALEKYPRQQEGSIVKFIIDKDWRSINFENTNIATGEITIEETNGYKINPAKNYVICFSSSFHPINERPVGNPFGFLYHYFGKNLSLLKKFLKDEFDLSDSTAEKTILEIPVVDWQILFTKEDVKYITKKIVKGKEVLDTKLLFSTPYIVKGVCYSNYSLMGTTEQAQYYYLWQDNRANEFMFRYCSSAVEFNKEYGKLGNSFRGNINDLINLYDGLNQASKEWKIPFFQLEHLNGFHANYFIAGKKVFGKNGLRLPEAQQERLILKTTDIEMVEDRIPTTLRDCYFELAELFWERASLVNLTTFIVNVLGLNFWKIITDYTNMQMIPGLFLSGDTQAGKTTFITLMKELLGFQRDSRKWSISGTTLQPAKQAATDNMFIHFEEFTNGIKDVHEDLIRQIINKTKTARGQADWSNITYYYRAWLLIDWERLPQEESVLNRFVICPMFKAEKAGNPESLNDLSKMSAFQNFVETAYKHWNTQDIYDSFVFFEKAFQATGMDSRQAMLYSYSATVARIFMELGDDLIVKRLSENANILSQYIGTRDILAEMLSELFIRHKVRGIEKIKNRISIPVTASMVKPYMIYWEEIRQKYCNAEKKPLVHLVGTVVGIELGQNVELDKLVGFYDNYISRTYLT